MATAKKITQPAYELCLTEDEARTLRSVCNSVAGCPTASPRKHTDAINKALRQLGVDPLLQDCSGRVSFDQ